MTILENISLKPYNTFGIDVNAKYFISVDTIDALKKVLKLKNYGAPFIIGGGSNMLLTKNVNALVIHNAIRGIEIINENSDFIEIKAAAGENWHHFVMWCIAHNYGGLENLSLIPGNVGTAPIQNIGAYGVELKDHFLSCQAINIKSLETTHFTKDDCQFGYRQSVFKNQLKGQYIITHVTFKLSKHSHKIKAEYGAINSRLESLNITNPTIKDLSDAIIHIRKQKLPDPKKIGNSGSFFKNPVINSNTFNKLLKNFNTIPHYKLSEKEIKIPAGWLIEMAGFKGKRFNNYGVHNKQALVLVNYGNAKGEDIFKLSKLIQKTVLRIFDIKLEAEVNII